MIFINCGVITTSVNGMFFFYLGHPSTMTVISPLFVRVYFFCNSHHTYCHSMLYRLLYCICIFHDGTHSQWKQFYTSAYSRTCMLLTVHQITTIFFSNMTDTRNFSNFFTLTWLHCSSLPRLGGSYFSNLLSFIPDWLRWGMGIAVMSDWLCSFFT